MADGQGWVDVPETGGWVDVPEAAPARTPGDLATRYQQAFQPQPFRYDLSSRYQQAFQRLPGGDLNAQPRRLLAMAPDGTPVYESDAFAPQPSAAGRTAGGIWDTAKSAALGFAQQLSDIWDTGMHGGIPSPDTVIRLGNMIQAHKDQAQKASEAFGQGQHMRATGHLLASISPYVEAGGHGLAAALPLIGPPAAELAEKYATGTAPVYDKYGNVIMPGQQPDVAGLIGAGGTMVAASVLPGLLRGEPAPEAGTGPPGPPATPPPSDITILRGFFRNANPQERAAYQYWRQQGMPPSAAMATGSYPISGLQKFTGVTPLGAVMDVAQLAKRTEALRTTATGAIGEATPEVSPDPLYAEFRASQDASPAVEVPTGVASDGSIIREKIKMPVDLRDIKDDIQPIADEYSYQPSGQLAASYGLPAIKNLLALPDHASAVAVERGLSGLKAAARGESGASASLIKMLIPKVQEAVNTAVQKYGGDDAMATLQDARHAAARQAGADALAEVFRKPMAAGGFDVGRNLWNWWRDLDPAQKSTMYSGKQIRDLDNLFLGIRMMADNPNVSGSALTGGIGAQLLGGAWTHGANPIFWLGQLGAAGFSALLRTDMGVQLLTEGLRIPRASAYGQMIRGRLRDILGVLPDEKPPEEPPPSPPPSTPPGSSGGPPINPTEAGGAPETAAPAPITWEPLQFRELQGMEGVSWIASDSFEDGGHFRAELIPRQPAGNWQWRYEEFNEAGQPVHDEVGTAPTRQQAERAVNEHAASLEGLTAAPVIPTEAESTAVGPARPGGSLADRLQNAADAAMQRMRDRGSFTGQKLNSMPDPQDLADMAIWGAAKIAYGTVKFGAWSKAMIADAGDAIKPHLEDLYARAQKIYERHIQTTEGNLPNTRQLLTKLKAGEAGKDWYDKTHAELVDMFGPDADMMEKFLAATSFNNTVAGNVTQALKAYQQWRTGQPFEGYLPAHKAHLEIAASGGIPGGLKGQSFYANLHGDPAAVTVDRWIGRAFGYPGSGFTPTQYHFMDYVITHIARKVGMEPRQVQAAIWKAARDEAGATGTGQSFEELLPERLANNPDMQKLIERAKSGAAVPPRP